MPPGTTPPFIATYNASSVPILQLALSGPGLSEQQLNDFGTNFIRTQLAIVPGAAIPWPYGGKQRQVMVDLQPAALQAKGLSAMDVVNAVTAQNLILPAGTSKIGQFEYDVDINGSPQTVREINDLPIKSVSGTTIYIRDVANVRDGFTPQTNIVRRDGLRGSLLTIQKVGSVSTLDIVRRVREMLPAISATLPPALKIEPLPADRRSIFVRASVDGVDSRGGDRRVPDGRHDPALPRKLAHHADHRGVDPALDPDFACVSGRAWGNHQHHDLGRIRAGRRHSG